MTPALADTLLAAFPADVEVRLHLDQPGPNGTQAPANETRAATTRLTAPMSGVRFNTSALTWPNVRSTEQPTWVSVWAGPTFLTAGVLTSSFGYEPGDTFEVAAGQMIVEFP